MHLPTHSEQAAPGNEAKQKMHYPKSDSTLFLSTLGTRNRLITCSNTFRTSKNGCNMRKYIDPVLEKSPQLTGNHEVSSLRSPDLRERHFFLPGSTFFPGPQESNQRFCGPRGMILTHFAPTNDEIGGPEASGAHFGVGKASYWC